MKKIFWVLIIVAVLALVGMRIWFGGFKESFECRECGHCEKSFLGINYYDKQIECPAENIPVVGGCAGVYLPYQAECCENLANENNILHVKCIGGWVVEDNICNWKCGEGETTADMCENWFVSNNQLREKCPGGWTIEMGQCKWVCSK